MSFLDFEDNAGGYIAAVSGNRRSHRSPGGVQRPDEAVEPEGEQAGEAGPSQAQREMTKGDSDGSEAQGDRVHATDEPPTE
jgi:hypothetical protein